MPDLVEGIPEEGIPEGMPDFGILEFFTLSLTMMMVDEGRNEVRNRKMKQGKSRGQCSVDGGNVPKNVGQANFEITLEVANRTVTLLSN